MMILAKMTYAMLVGVIGHQTSPLFNKWDDRGRGIWVLIGRYAVGTILLVVASIPFVPRGHNEEAVKIAFTVSTCVGAGVAAGYVIDELLADYEQINSIDV